MRAHPEGKIEAADDSCERVDGSARRVRHAPAMTEGQTMPDEVEIEELRQHLEASKAELQKLLDLSREGGAPVALDTPIGRLTRVAALQQQSMTLATLRASEARLGQINAALDRVARESYGDCLVCGEPIALARLRVRPEAALCVSCQEARERRS
jgi:DnaK suppressor protein